MKQHLFFVAFIMPWFSILQSQCYHPSDSLIYSNAYNYIVADSLFLNKPVNVSNQLTGTCYMCFFNELKGSDDTESFYKKLSQLDKEYASNDSTCKYFDECFFKYAKSDIMLSFSKIADCDLFAEVQIGNFGINTLGERVFYYFTFDLNGNLKFIRKKIMYGL